MSVKDFIVATKYKLIRKIGSGSFGDIYVSINVTNGEEVAIKLESNRVSLSSFHILFRIIIHYRFLGEAPAVAVRVQSVSYPTGRSRNSTYQMVTFFYKKDLGTYLPRLNCSKTCNFRYGTEREYNVLVMDLLGPSLEDLFNFCSRRFTMKVSGDE